MAGREDIIAAMAPLKLFGDLAGPEREAAASQFRETWFSEGERVLRQGLSGSGFYVILEGECSIRVDGEERSRLGRGQFFGEMAILLGSTPVADVVALTRVRCLAIGPEEAKAFIMAHPRFMYQMLVTLAERLSAANRRNG